MNDFVLIDQVILKSLGYEHFKSVTRYLCKNATEFKKGKTFDDEHADYVIQRCKYIINKRGGAHFFQKLFVRRTVFDKWMTRVQLQIKRKPAENNFVYFIHEEGDLTQFKIGFSTDLEKRLATLQIGNPRNLIVYKTIANASKKKEKEMQDFFNAYHIRGEWYKITCDMIDAVVLKNNI